MDMFDYSKATANQAEAALSRLMKYLKWYNGLAAKISSKIMVPDYVKTACSNALATAKRAGNLAGYAVNLRRMNEIMDKIYALPDPKDSRIVAPLFGELMVLAASFIKSVPGCERYGQVFEVFGEHLNSIVHDVLMGEKGMHDDANKNFYHSMLRAEINQ